MSFLKLVSKQHSFKFGNKENKDNSPNSTYENGKNNTSRSNSKIKKFKSKTCMDFEGFN